MNQKFIFKTSQTQRDDYPEQKIVIASGWKNIIKKRNIRLKNYLSYLVFLLHGGVNPNVIDWMILNEGSLLIRKQLPQLYLIVSKILLQIKKEKSYWIKNELHTKIDIDWIPTNFLRQCKGISLGQEGKELEEFRNLLCEYSNQLYQEFLSGNIVLFEAGVSENNNVVVYPIRRKGYKDKGNLKPDHQKGRNERDQETYNPWTKVGIHPSEDLEILALLGPAEFSSSLE